MAVASCETAKSVVALSKSPVFHHQYSSLTAAVSHLANSERELKRVRKLFREHRLKYFPVRAVNHFQSDVVNIFRQYSPCLQNRQYRHKANNVIGGNKPIGIGYGLSLVNMADFQSSWSLPFELRRVKSNEDEIEVAAQQIRAICESQEFAEVLNINAADSSYGVAKYLSQVNEIGNLVNVIRLRHGNKIYLSENRETGGAPQIYGEKYYLIEQTGTRHYRKKKKTYAVEQHSIYEKIADEEAEIKRKTRKGKELRIALEAVEADENENQARQLDERSRV